MHCKLVTTTVNQTSHVDEASLRHDDGVLDHVVVDSSALIHSDANN
jgi:hypothetical protein